MTGRTCHCLDTSLTALEILQLYGYRFKIELGFRQAVHVLGAYGYHFWMLGMKPLRRGTGGPVFASDLG